MTGFDLDLRLSAAHITVATAKFGRTAIATNLRGGKLAMAIGESQAFGGILKGSMALASSDAGADFKSQLQFTDVDLESALARSCTSAGSRAAATWRSSSTPPATACWR